MHTWIRGVCYVLLFGLAIEGALTVPLPAIWYGVPELSPLEVCSELQKIMYSDGHAECETPYPLGGPPFGGQGEGEGAGSGIGRATAIELAARILPGRTGLIGRALDLVT